MHANAMRTAIRLTDYEDMLDPATVYSLVALTAFYNRNYQECSKAFVKLESMKKVSPGMLESECA
jgi:WD repeat-containing protein 35